MASSWRPFMSEYPDGDGLFELEPPRTEGPAEYTQRVSGPEHDERLHEVVARRQEVPERAAVEDIEWAAGLVAGIAEREQHHDRGNAVETGWTGSGVTAWSAQRRKAEQQLDAAKRHGREVLRDWSGWSGDASTDRLIAHSREVLGRAVRERSDAEHEVERGDAVRRWAVDDEIAMADADGVLDGWQW